MPNEMKSTARERFLSLDVFRGLTIFLMIIVNTPGKGAALFPFLIHVKWFGFTLADLVFPSFLFAMGNAMSFSMKKFDGVPSSVFWKNVLRRTFLIFIFGYLMYWFPFVRQAATGAWEWIPFDQTRVLGVLQRIALCYFFASAAVKYLSERGTIILSAVLLLGYWGMLMLWGDAGAELTVAGNAVGKLDTFLLGVGHIYKKDVAPFDPEGLLSTLPAIVNVIAGYIAGVYIQRKGKNMSTVLNFVIPGALFIVLALVWHPVFPIAKKLWTSPFVLCTVGMDLLLLAGLIYTIEMKNVRAGTSFFTVFGKNPLFIYLFSELFYTVLCMIKLPGGMNVFEWVSIEVFQRVLPGAFGALATAVAYTMLCWLLGWWMDRRKLYIRI